MTASDWQAGIDVGGTNTDLLLLDTATDGFRVAKVPTTPEDQSVGVLAALGAAEADMAGLAAIVHGTTIATNAVLERKGARIEGPAVIVESETATVLSTLFDAIVDGRGYIDCSRRATPET
jgi:N-methylhydantoinase A/oxoprolinase/acetone carboxylase beta subunit